MMLYFSISLNSGLDSGNNCIVCALSSRVSARSLAAGVTAVLCVCACVCVCVCVCMREKRYHFKSVS